MDNDKHISKDELGIKAKCKTIIMVHSLCQYDIAEKDGSIFYYFILEKLLIHYLKKVTRMCGPGYDIKLKILTPFIFYYPSRFDNFEIIPIQYSKENPIPDSTFDEIFSGVDLILSDNIMQESFHRGLINGKLGINIRSTLPVITNADASVSLRPEFKLTPTTQEALDVMESTKPLMAAKINVMPESLAFKTNNKLKKLITTVELLDEINMVDTIFKSLFDNEYKENFYSQLATMKNHNF